MSLLTKHLTNPFDLAALIQKNKASLLGEKGPESEDEVAKDAAKIVKYTTKEEYKALEKEMWFQFEGALNRLMEEKLTNEEAHYCRGILSGTMAILRTAGKARKKLEEK